VRSLTQVPHVDFGATRVPILGARVQIAYHTSMTTPQMSGHRSEQGSGCRSLARNRITLYIFSAQLGFLLRYYDPCCFVFLPTASQIAVTNNAHPLRPVNVYTGARGQGELRQLCRDAYSNKSRNSTPHSPTNMTRSQCWLAPVKITLVVRDRKPRTKSTTPQGFKQLCSALRTPAHKHS